MVAYAAILLSLSSMKKAILSLTLSLFATVLAMAQNYEPTTTWPYVYPEFASGELLSPKGVSTLGQYNIHLSGGALHFIDGDLIREVSARDVLYVVIGEDRYANVEGKMMKILASDSKGIVARESLVDFVKLNGTGGAYGSSSSTIATTALSSMEQIGSGKTGVNHMELKNSKEAGQILPLTEKLWLVTEGKAVFASKKDVSQIEGIDKDAFKVFFKENPVKWKNPESLLKVVDFIADNI